MLAPGALIDRYELVNPIGKGGMASVWAARQHGKHGFEKLVALKIIHSRYAEDPGFRAMFLDEARLVAPLVHRNVAQVFDLGDTGDLLYIALEYVDGESLYGLTGPSGIVPLPVALRIAADACAGLAAVHALTDHQGQPRNIVHRDVSPQNILLSTAGEVKLIDFGIAKARDRVTKTTDANTVKGKVRYMSPEQARREEVGPPTDVFAIGAVLFRMLAGEPPYAAANEIATIQALYAKAPALLQLPPNVPPEVVAVVHQAIAPEIGDRFLTARALKEALENILASESRAPDVAAWVAATMGEDTRKRHALLATRLAAPPPSHDPPPAPAPTPRIDRPREVPQTLVMESRPASELGAPMTTPELVVPTTAPMVAPLAPPPSGDPGAPPPAFMDVHALVAQAKAGVVHAPPPPEPTAPPPRPRSGTAEMKAAPPPPAPEPRIDLAVVPRTAAEGPRWGSAPKIAALAIAGIVLAVGVFLLLPALVRSRAVALAHDAGFEIEVGSAGIGFGGIRLRGVKARTPRAPGFHAEIEEVTAPLSLALKEVRLVSPSIVLEGDLVELEVGLGGLLEEDRVKLAGTPEAPRKLAIVGGKLTWNATPDAPSSSRSRLLDATELAVDVESRGAGTEDVRGTIGKTTLKTPQSTFGPWGFSLERTASQARVRVVLDPPVIDGPSVLVVASSEGATEVTARIPRYAWAHLGLRPEDLGIGVDPTSEVELNLAASAKPTAPSTLKLATTIYRLKPAGFSGPVDAKADIEAGGPPGKPLVLSKANLAVGPFTATATGSITPYDTSPIEKGVRIDALFKVTPIGCDRVAKGLGGPVSFVQALGQATGALRVTGNVNVSGVVKYDSATPTDATVSWLARESCGVSIFGL